MKNSLLNKVFYACVALALTTLVSGLSIYTIAQKTTTSLSKQKTQLESKKKHLAQEIAKANKELSSTTDKQKKTVQYINQLSTKIQFREELVETYKSEVQVIESEMEVQKARKLDLQNLEESLLEQYARMVYFAYKNRNSDDKFLYVLAADDMNQAFARARYFNQLAGFRRVQLAQIKETKENLEKVIAVLDSNRIAKSNVLKLEEEEKIKLEQEKLEQQKVAQQLKGKEAEIKKKIAQKEVERKNLESKIQDIVRKLIEEERKKAEAEAKKKAAAAAAANKSTSTTSSSSGTKTSTSTTSSGSKVNVDAVTPETKLKSASFEGNKGSMPWPVEKGAITGKYGVQPHAYLKGVTVKNDGVDISAPAGSTARAIYDGDVSGVFAVDGYGKVVIIQHGVYYTVYSNLSEVSVSKGNKVKIKQSLGKIMTGESGKAVMNFQIRKGSETLNPASWLAY